jgi:hypothetical protein
MIEGCRRRLAKYQFDAGALDLQPSVSAITRRGLTVLLMLAVSGVADVLPGAGTVLFRSITIAVLLKFGLAVAVIWLLFQAFRPAVCVLGHFAREAFHLPPGETTLDASSLELAWSVTLLVYVCLVYWVFLRAFSPVLAAFTVRRWPFLVMDLGSLAVAVVAIVGIFMATSPLFGKVGDAVARRVGAEPEDDTPQSKCAKCGVLYAGESRYCAFCGAALPRTPRNTDGLNEQAAQPAGTKRQNIE